MANPEYRLRFADRVQKLMFNGGMLTPAGAAAVYQARMNQVRRTRIVGESARWGDNHDEPGYTRANWLATQNGLLANYFPNRTGSVLGQYNTRGWMPSLGAPIYSQIGGTVNPGLPAHDQQARRLAGRRGHLLHARRLRSARCRRRRSAAPRRNTPARSR